MALQILDRLWQKTIINKETGCWLYEGSNDGRRGYGKIRFQGVKKTVHRVSAHLYHNMDLSDSTLQALHKNICPFKNCWNPDHIYVGTHRDNVNDTINSGILFTRKTKQGRNNILCLKGLHELTKDNLIWFNGIRRCKICYYNSHPRKEK